MDTPADRAATSMENAINAKELREAAQELRSWDSIQIGVRTFSTTELADACEMAARTFDRKEKSELAETLLGFARKALKQ